jgi:hypothetical protein
MSISLGIYSSHYFCVCTVCRGNTEYDAENGIKETKEITKVGLKRLKLSIINGLEKLETNTEFSGGNGLRYGKRNVRKN